MQAGFRCCDCQDHPNLHVRSQSQFYRWLASRQKRGGFCGSLCYFKRNFGRDMKR